MIPAYFHRTPFWAPLIYPGLTWKNPGLEQNIYLSFDDGPIPEVTPFVLDTLAQYNAKAVFFCVGENISRYPELSRHILAEGHLIGNHTMRHLKGWQTANEEYLSDITKADKVIAELGVNGLPLFRPPYGKISRSQIKALKGRNIIMWDVLTGDFDKNLSPDDCLHNSIKATRAGSIVVWHDSIKSKDRLEYALPRYLAHFNKLGYQFPLL